jgi:hypothetical protein
MRRWTRWAECDLEHPDDEPVAADNTHGNQRPNSKGEREEDKSFSISKRTGISFSWMRIYQLWHGDPLHNLT